MPTLIDGPSSSLFSPVTFNGNVSAADLKEAGLSERIDFCEMGVAELGAERARSYDAAMSGLCFSELSEDEIAYLDKPIIA